MLKEVVMLNPLFNRASKNFEKYLKEFQENGNVYMLPHSRLNEEEWKTLNATLVQQGVRLIPVKKSGVSYMMFSALPKRSSSKIDDTNLGPTLKNLTGLDWEHKTTQTSGLGFEHYRIKIDNYPQTQVQQIIDILNQNAIYDVNVINTNKGKFLVAQAPDELLSSVLGYYRTVIFQGKPVYVCAQNGMKRETAKKCASMITQNETYFATTLNKEGYHGADYMVIAIKKSDAEQLGADCRSNTPYLRRDNTKEKQNLQKMIGVPLTYINDTAVTIESMSDFGALADRAVVLVKVGNKKLPFYISTGTAGKTDIPTGKWEFFGGIDSNGLFRKGTFDDIISHYHSPELKQIANALDSKIGDLRDTIDVLKTVGRQSLGGTGIVASLQHSPYIRINQVNEYVFSPKNEEIFALDLIDIKSYLHQLRTSPNKVKNMENSTKSLKSKLFSHLSQLFKSNNTNNQQKK